jgi:hypothetical protein
MKLDVDRANDRLLVFCGSGGTGLDKLLLLGDDGHEIARLEDDLAPPNGLAISPAGDLALVAMGLFGDDLRLLKLGATTLTQVGAPLTSIRSPQDVIFHPTSAAGDASALISNLDRNRVTPIHLSSQGIVSGAVVTNMPLAAELDVIERGPQLGTVLVVGTSSVYRTLLGRDGTAVTGGTALEFGQGTTNIAQGIAIQR